MNEACRKTVVIIIQSIDKVSFSVLLLALVQIVWPEQHMPDSLAKVVQQCTIMQSALCINSARQFCYVEETGVR